MDVDAILERLAGLDEDELADVLRDDPEARAFVVQQLGVEGITVAGLDRAGATPQLLTSELAEQWLFATSDDGGSGVSA